MPNVAEIPIRTVAFDLSIGYLEEEDVPVVGVSISHPDEKTGVLQEAHSFILHCGDAANVGNSLIRLAAGSIFYAALETFAAMRAEAGDRAAAQALQDFRDWFQSNDSARAADESDIALERMGVRRAGHDAA